MPQPKAKVGTLVPNSDLRIFAIVTLLALTACDTKADKLSEQYGMLKASSASKSEMCEFSTKVSKQYFDEGDESEFLKWEKVRKADCDIAASVLRLPVGAISGSLSYPSDYIPKDMSVCARHTETREDTCKVTGTKESYRLELAPGTYLVWAKTKDWSGRAFYTKAIACGLSVECTNHEPIEVVVQAGQTTRNVDPGDYYSN